MKTFEEWVEISNKIHNSTYEYINIFKKHNGYYFTLKCNKHGTFEKKIANHIQKKQGCPKCTNELSSLNQRQTQEDFILKAKLVHGDKYDYSLVNYIDTNLKVKIICKEHGIFEQLPCNHYKQNCPSCCKNKKITTEIFVNRAKEINGDKYDYNDVKYVNITTPVKIICKIHGMFLQTPREHFSGCGCYKCANRILNTKDFIEKASYRHNNLYHYTKTLYVNARNKIIITCKIHGDFLQNPNDHLNGCGCQKCGLGNYSKIAIEWLDTIMITQNIFIQHANNQGEYVIHLDNKKFKVDGYCRETNTIYEFYGDIWHGNPCKYKPNDFNPINKKTYGELYDDTIKRENEIKNLNYNLITIWESDYNINKNK